MKISVIAVTVRIGCLDILANGFARQTFPQDDFEVLLIDSFYNERHKIIATRLPANFFHMPLPEDKPNYDACYANNYGLRHASGELVVFFTDCNWPARDFLAEHWRIYKEVPGYSATGYVDRYYAPELRAPTSVNGQACYGYDDVAWSVFAREFTTDYADEFFASQKPFYQERKGHLVDGFVTGTNYAELPPEKWYGSLNESIPMSVMRKINGWDEIYDGAYGVSDIDVGWRAHQAGWRFLVLPDLINYKLGDQSTARTIPGKYKPRVEGQDNLAIFEQVKADVRDGKRTYRAEQGAWL